jgi:hypothetical protein
LVLREFRVSRARKVIPELQDQGAGVDRRARRVILVTLVLRDQRDRLAHEGAVDRRVTRVTMEPPVLLVREEGRVRRATRATKVTRVIPAPQDHEAREDRLVSPHLSPVHQEATLS